jgi:hypothetical protein
MNPLIETGAISELSCGMNFAYLLSDNNTFIMTEYKVLQNQGSNGFIKCMKMLYNGKTELYYLTSGYKAFSAMLPTLDADNFMIIAANLIKDIIDVKANGFLSCNNIDISFDKIYIDPNTLQVNLIYLPISQRAFNDYVSFENELRTSLVKLINNIPVFSQGKPMQFSVDLSDGTLSLEDLYNRIKGIKSPLKGTQSDSRLNSNENRILRIIALNAPIRVEIAVNKNEFLIGKNAAVVDGAVTFNKAISRVHCKVTKMDNQYFLTDLESSNGTYVNKIRLQPNRPHPIANGDIIRLANSDFQVCI